MGAYLYCSNCKHENGIGYPDLRSRLKGFVQCPQCGFENDLSDSFDDAIDELVTRLEAAERKIENHTKG